MTCLALWNHPAASSETRKRILRTVLKEIVVTISDRAQQRQKIIHNRVASVGEESGQLPSRACSPSGTEGLQTLRWREMDSNC